ncbi:erythromycin esterase family protein [Paenibacillus flagellatus]|nr:erythromycin esterase family protein [Paenibacillus flagellatus]
MEPHIEPIVDRIRRDSFRLNGPDDLDRIVEAAGNAKYVLLGEASHGTSEFYTLRTELTKKLVERKGFRFVAVEGDFPSCQAVNRYVKGASGKPDWLASFDRWPTWMWANREIVALAEWMRGFNEARGFAGASSPSGTGDVGFYGIDVYSLWESMEETIRHLESTGAPEAELARRAFSCFEPHLRDGQSYGVAAAFFSETCEDEVVKLLAALRTKRAAAENGDEGALGAEINALVAVDAERYYRSMVRGGEESWNIRDRHMVEALERIAAFYGPDAKAIVWEHNTHIGDARATDMADEGMVNVGQLLRERHGERDVFAVGFGTYEGTVIAARAWGAPIETMRVPPGVPGSWEHCMHLAGAWDKAIVFGGDQPEFERPIPHRAIGVVYAPERERYGNYVPSVMADRYDAFVHVETTRALQPLEAEPAAGAR